MSKPIATNSLRTFAAAARHANFTAAARELHSTQSAVSQTVRRLEQELGLRLFERVHRGVRLTAEGAVLYASVREGFAAIDRGIEQLQRRRHQPHLKIFTDFACAAYWLLPRLPGFRARYPHINVQLVTDQGVADWQHQDIDVAIVFCDETELAHVPCLFSESVLPVCSPHLLEQHGPITNLNALSQAPLLTLSMDTDAKWLDWPRYFGSQPQLVTSTAPDLTFNNYTLLIQAAIAGQGVALGWQQLVAGAMRDNMLVGLDSMRVTTHCGYGLMDARPAQTSAAKTALLRWLLGSA